MAYQVPPSLALAVFGRAPSPGKTKTRLIPVLGARGAAQFQAALISDALRKAGALRGRIRRYFFLAGRKRAVRLPAGLTLLAQRGADLGARLEDAFRRLLARHGRVVVMGTDSPTLPARLIRQALAELEFCDAALGPCPDGGYYLIGLRRQGVGRRLRGVFRGVRWSSSFAFRDTLRNFLARGWSCSVLEPWGDVDRPEDLRRLKKELTDSVAARRRAPATWRLMRDAM